MSKEKLRKSTISFLKELSIDQRSDIEKLLQHHLLSSEIWKNSKMIGITMSQDFEWDTKPIIEAAWNESKSICVPKCYPKQNKLKFYEIESFVQLEKNFYDLLEPNPNQTRYIKQNLIDLLIVPGLLFDKRGFRIGFGGGYYDRFLVNYNNTTVSLASSKQLVKKIPSEKFDIPVQHIITEKGQYT